MVFKVFLSFVFILLSFLANISPARAAWDADGRWIPLPPCGDFCYTLQSGKSICSTWESGFYPSIDNCYCNDDEFLSNFVDCLVNGDYCTSIQDFNRSMEYIQDDCYEVGRHLPEDFEELKESLHVTGAATKTTFIMPVEPTTYTWAFTATNEFLEVITTVGPCESESTSSNVDKVSKRHDISNGTLVETITSTEIVLIIVTNTITITADELSFSTQELRESSGTIIMTTPGLTTPGPPSTTHLTDHPISSSPVVKLLLDSVEEMHTKGFSSSSLCPVNVTVTRTAPLITTYYSSMTYNIITEDTRSDRPTSLFTFWTSTATSSPTPAEENVNGGSNVVSGGNILLIGVALLLSTTLLSIF